MNNAKNESEKILEQVHTCRIDLISLLEKIEEKLEKDKDNKDLLEAKRIVNDRIRVKEIITGVHQ